MIDMNTYPERLSKHYHRKDCTMSCVNMNESTGSYDKTKTSYKPSM